MGLTLDDMEEAVVQQLLRLAFEEHCLFVEVVQQRDVYLGRHFHRVAQAAQDLRVDGLPGRDLLDGLQEDLLL